MDPETAAKIEALKRLQAMGMGDEPGQFPDDDRALGTQTDAEKLQDNLNQYNRQKQLQDLLNQAK